MGCDLYLNTLVADASYKLHIHGRLCRSRVQQFGGFHVTAGFEGSFSRPYHALTRQSRKPTDNAGATS